MRHRALLNALKKYTPLTVADLMDRNYNAIFPETPIWEAINHLVNSNGPLLVVDAEKKQYIGMITAQTALDELKRLQESEG